MKDSMSLLLDGECSDSELDQILAEMERDPALREQFSRQVLAREAREGTRFRTANLDFSAKVFAALQNEPAPAEPAVIVPIGNRVRRLPWRAAVSLAAAATVGAIAVLVVRPVGPGAPIAGTIETASVPAAGIIPVGAEPVEKQFSELADADAQQLRNYLMTYSQSRGQQGVGSTLGYARYAAYTDARPAARTTEIKSP
jgi:negative regulator of sigma E activity